MSPPSNEYTNFNAKLNQGKSFCLERPAVLVAAAEGALEQVSEREDGGPHGEVRKLRVDIPLPEAEDQAERKQDEPERFQEPPEDEADITDWRRPPGRGRLARRGPESSAAGRA